MSKTFNVECEQNAEVSKKIPCRKPLLEQLKIMEEYTAVHRASLDLSPAAREINCLKVLYPTMLAPVEETDLLAGRLDFLPIGFGCVTSVGGVGHYCVFAKLRAFQKQLPLEEQSRVDKLYDYWLDHDTKTIYGQDVFNDSTVGPFIDCHFPMIATVRLSGMMLDYQKLLELGIPGIQRELAARIEAEPDNEYLLHSREAMDLFLLSAQKLKGDLQDLTKSATAMRKAQLTKMIDSLDAIGRRAPKTFHEALQLFWLYALLAGVINYGRLDDVLGPFLVRDLENGTETHDSAAALLTSLWIMIENRRTTVNGRIIVGGKGRKHPKEADEFARLALEVSGKLRYVEPQFTLRFDQDTPQDILDRALDNLGQGATYPTLYNDEVNVPALTYAMRVDEQTAEQYVPFGCTEFVIQGQSTGTPNVCLNLLKILTIQLGQGVDPMDGIAKCGPVEMLPLAAYDTFEKLYEKYKELLQYYIDLSIQAQTHSYQVMREQVSFLFMSALTDDCIKRGMALLDGGVRYLGGTNETYGNINKSDSLYAIKKLVYDERKYTLEEIVTATNRNFEQDALLRRDLLACDKYGNDLEEVDALANDLYEFVAKGVRQTGINAGMQYYLIVISNNQVNTEWGRLTGATPDGRLRGMYMNPANNPQSGAAKSGPTAMLNSLAKFNPKYHAGSVQSIKFTPRMFNRDRDLIKALFRTYFDQGGCHLMVTVVDRGILEDAVVHPENYPDLLVRVSGFSAVFVNLEPDVQQEVMSRVLFDES